MKILVTGANGQVGWELVRTLQPLGEIVVAGREQLNLAELDGLRSRLRTIKPDVIINAAAYTGVDKAEEECDLADRINAQAPLVMAEELKKTDGLLVHYSTDYVFDGSLDRPYLESDKPEPINEYGKSKLAGEVAIQGIEGDFVILRTSWVYAARAHNFLKSILRLAAEREELKIVSDQQGTPTWARLIAETTGHVLRQSLLEKNNDCFVSDTYHLTSSGSTSWHGFSEVIVDLAKEIDGLPVKTQKIKPIPASAYPLPAPRPQNSRLDMSKLEKKFNLVMPHWRAALNYCMRDI